MDRLFNGLILLFWRCYFENNYAPSAILIDISKCLVDEQIKIKELMATFPNITITASTSNYIEVRPKNSNKGIAFKDIIRILWDRKKWNIKYRW